MCCIFEWICCLCNGLRECFSEWVSCLRGDNCGQTMGPSCLTKCRGRSVPFKFLGNCAAGLGIIQSLVWIGLASYVLKHADRYPDGFIEFPDLFKKPEARGYFRRNIISKSESKTTPVFYNIPVMIDMLNTSKEQPQKQKLKQSYTKISGLKKTTSNRFRESDVNYGVGNHLDSIYRDRNKEHSTMIEDLEESVVTEAFPKEESITMDSSFQTELEQQLRIIEENKTSTTFPSIEKLVPCLENTTTVSENLISSQDFIQEISTRQDNQDELTSTDVENAITMNYFAKFTKNNRKSTTEKVLDLFRKFFKIWKTTKQDTTKTSQESLEVETSPRVTKILKDMEIQTMKFDGNTNISGSQNIKTIKPREYITPLIKQFSQFPSTPVSPTRNRKTLGPIWLHIFGRKNDTGQEKILHNPKLTMCNNIANL